MQDLNLTSAAHEVSSVWLTLDTAFNNARLLLDLIHSLDLALSAPELSCQDGNRLRGLTRVQIELLESLRADLGEVMKTIHSGAAP